MLRRIRLVKVLLGASMLAGTIFAVPPAYGQKFEELALTPPMGWNSWNHFGCDMNEQIVRDIADSIVTTGMRDAGYVYLNIDDCWTKSRDGEGNLQADAERFPSGMKALAEYVHSKGLKFGIYSDVGPKTCGEWPGSGGNEYRDAITFASWGVDYLKYDWCFSDGLDPVEAYQTMSTALAEAGRPVVFSICEWGLSKPWEWARSVGHLWRTVGDITVCFDCVVDHGDWYSWGIMPIVDRQVNLRAYAGPGHWNDPDILEVGNGMTPAEDRAHFSLWSMLAAPLLTGNDVRNMSREALETLTNSEVIAVDQDSLGIQGFRYAQSNEIQIWFKPLMHGAWAMAVVNRSSQTRTFRFDWARERVVDAEFFRDAAFDEIEYNVRNLWLHEDRGTTTEPLVEDIASHDVLMLRLEPMGAFDGQVAEHGSDRMIVGIFPNPATVYTSVRFLSLDSGRMAIDVYSVLGRHVLHAIERELPAGLHTVNIQLDALAPGSYFVRVEHAGSVKVKPLQIVH